MKKRIVLLAAMALAAAAQTEIPGMPARETTKKPVAARKAAPVKPASAPSYHELKYPALRPIQIPNVSTFTLPNGLRLYLLEDHELPVVNGTARVRVGNLFDPPDKIGLATITGTVMRTGGTKQKTGDQLDTELENQAAVVESGIGETVGSVSFQALKENTDTVLGVFHDVLTAPEFRQEKIDLAKSQMRSGIARRNDNASAVSNREFRNIVYGKDTPYGWSDEYATLDLINRADLQNFYRRYFFPANVMLAIWGDFQTDEMKARIEKRFADWTAQQSPVPEFPKVTAKPAPGIYLARNNDVSQTFVNIGHLGGDFRDKDYAALQIMSTILGGGFQSRLFQNLRTRMGNVYDVSADWAGEFDHPGVFQITTSTRALVTVETIQTIRQEVERIRTSEVTDAELTTAKETALNSLVFAYDTKSKTLSRLLTYEYYGYPKDFIQQFQKALAAVTKADVLRVAKTRLDPSEFVLVAAGNPSLFGKGLETLGGPVTPIDLTITPPRMEVSKSDSASQAKGKQLLQRAQQAAGGVEKLAGIQDYLQNADLKLAPRVGGFTVKQTTRWMTPTHFREESEGPGGRISAYTDGKTGWLVSPKGGGAMVDAQLKAVSGDMFRLYFLLLTSDRIEGRNLNALDDNTVEISDTSGQVAKLVLDPETGLPQKVLYDLIQPSAPPVTVENDFGDFRDYAGIKLPFQISILQGGEKFAVTTVTEVRMNSGLKLEDLIRRP